MIVRQPGDEVHRGLLIRIGQEPPLGGDLLGVLREVPVEHLHHLIAPLPVGNERRRQVDPAEHEFPELQERLVSLGGHMDRRAVHGTGNEVGHHGGDHFRMGLAEAAAHIVRQVLRREEPRRLRVVEVVAEIGDAVRVFQELSLRRGRPHGTGVVQNAVPHLPGEIEPLPALFEHFHDAHALLIVMEMAAGVIEGGLSHVAEGRVPQIVTEGHGLDEVLIEAERPRHGAPDLGHLQRVGHAGAVVVAPGRDVYLRLVLHPPEEAAVQDAVPVPLKGRAEGTLLFRPVPAGRIGKGRPRAEQLPFDSLCAFSNGHRHLAGKGRRGGRMKNVLSLTVTKSTALSQGSAFFFSIFRRRAGGSAG